MPDVIACPDPTCQVPACVRDRWTWGSRHGPVEHVKTGRERGHWFTPPSTRSSRRPTRPTRPTVPRQPSELSRFVDQCWCVLALALTVVGRPVGPDSAAGRPPPPMTPIGAATK